MITLMLALTLAAPPGIISDPIRDVCGSRSMTECELPVRDCVNEISEALASCGARAHNARSIICRNVLRDFGGADMETVARYCKAAKESGVRVIQ